MRSARLFFILLIAAFAWGCDHTNIFSSRDDEKTTEPYDGPSGETVIAMYVTGGFAGVNQQLLIDANRYVRYTDAGLQNGQLETILAAEEHTRLIRLFIEKDFFHLQSQYLDAKIADAFYYRIIFRHGGAVKEVATDYFSAPADLQILIDNLRNIVDNLRTNSLMLEFKTSADTLHHGGKLTLTLIATNRSATPLTLRFRSGQVFDFFATLPVVTTNAFPPPFVWNWAHDKVFIAVITTKTWQPGERYTYEVEWDGRNNKGDFVDGEFWLGARLVAIPGGYSPLRRVVVLK